MFAYIVTFQVSNHATNNNTFFCAIAATFFPSVSPAYLFTLLSALGPANFATFIAAELSAQLRSHTSTKRTAFYAAIGLSFEPTLWTPIHPADHATFFIAYA